MKTVLKNWKKQFDREEEVLFTTRDYLHLFFFTMGFCFVVGLVTAAFSGATLPKQLLIISLYSLIGVLSPSFWLQYLVYQKNKRLKKQKEQFHTALENPKPILDDLQLNALYHEMWQTKDQEKIWSELRAHYSKKEAVKRTP